MKALVLAAGYGTRMGSLQGRPKALLEVGGKTILGRILEKLGEVEEIDKVFIVTNSRFFGDFEEWLRNCKTEKEVVLVNDRTDSNKTRLGAVGDIGFVIQEKKIEDDLMVLCSDRIFEFSLRDFYGFFREKGTAVNMCQDVGDPGLLKGKSASAVLGSDGRILELEEKPENPKSSILSLAFYIYPREMLELFQEYLEGGNNPDAPGHFLEWLVKREKVYALLSGERCLDIGSPESLEKARRALGD